MCYHDADLPVGDIGHWALLIFYIVKYRNQVQCKPPVKNRQHYRSIRLNIHWHKAVTAQSTERDSLDKCLPQFEQSLHLSLAYQTRERERERERDRDRENGLSG